MFFLKMQQLQINVLWLIVLTYSGRRQRTSRSNDSRIIFLSLPLINSNRNIGTTNRLPSFRHSIALIFIVVRIVTMNGAFDRRFRRSLEISKNKSSSDQRAFSTASSSFRRTRFLRCGNRSNKESCYALSLCITPKRCAHQNIQMRAYRHTQRPFVLYSHDIEKYVNLKKKNICIYHMYMYICIFLAYVHYVYIT